VETQQQQQSILKFGGFKPECRRKPGTGFHPSLIVETSLQHHQHCQTWVNKAIMALYHNTRSPF